MILRENQVVKNLNGSQQPLGKTGGGGGISQLTPETPVNIGSSNITLETFIDRESADVTNTILRNKQIDLTYSRLTSSKVSWAIPDITEFFEFKRTNETNFLLRVTGWANNDSVYKREAIVYYEEGEGWTCLYGEGDAEITFTIEDSPEPSSAGTWIRFTNTSNLRVVVEIVGLTYL